MRARLRFCQTSVSLGQQLSIVITSAGGSYNKSATPQIRKTPQYTKPHKQ
jgi:hypothetical protein